ncbi:hypothetical protein KAU08_05310, partial [bacterium]|nr:hypothetical protein [bacterium]
NETLTAYGVAFRTSNGDRIFKTARELGLAAETLVPDSWYIEESHPITWLGWYVNYIDGIPIGYFHLMDGNYIGMRLTVDKPRDGWLLWQNEITPLSGWNSDIGRLNPDPETGPGDCWINWASSTGGVQIIDLGTGSELFNGHFETEPYPIGDDREVAQGSLAIGDIDGSMPQELCWWDAGAWTLRIYRLMPPVE